MIWKLCKTGAEEAHAQPPAVKPKKKNARCNQFQELQKFIHHGNIRCSKNDTWWGSRPSWMGQKTDSIKSLSFMVESVCGSNNRYTMMNKVFGNALLIQAQSKSLRRMYCSYCNAMAMYFTIFMFEIG